MSISALLGGRAASARARARYSLKAKRPKSLLSLRWLVRAHARQQGSEQQRRRARVSVLSARAPIFLRRGPGGVQRPENHKAFGFREQTGGRSLLARRARARPLPRFRRAAAVHCALTSSLTCLLGVRRAAACERGARAEHKQQTRAACLPRAALLPQKHTHPPLSLNMAGRMRTPSPQARVAAKRSGIGSVGPAVACTPPLSLAPESAALLLSLTSSCSPGCVEPGASVLGR